MGDEDGAVGQGVALALADEADDGKERHDEVCDAYDQSCQVERGEEREPRYLMPPGGGVGCCVESGALELYDFAY